MSSYVVPLNFGSVFGIYAVCFDYKAITRFWRFGKVVIELQFDYLNDFCEGLAVAGINDKFGYIDKSGKFVIEPKFDDAYDFSDGVAEVTLDGEEFNMTSKVIE